MDNPAINKDTDTEIRRQKIIHLLTRVLDKYEVEKGVTIKRDSYREHYKDVAKRLTEISTQLTQWEPTMFLVKPEETVFYRVKEGQVEAAFNGRVQKMKPYFAATCFLYLQGGMSLKGYEKQINELSKADTLD